MGARVVTLRSDRGAFRLSMPDGSYRDFQGGGILSVDDSDPHFDMLLAWAAKRPDVTVFTEGRVTQRGEPVCPVCWQPVEDDDDLAKHTREVHAPDPDADNLEQEEPVARPFRRRGR